MLNARRIKTTELKDDFESMSAPKIKKAASRVFKKKLAGYEEQLLSSLVYLIEKPKSWQAQSEVIKAIGVTGSEKSLPYLKALASHQFESTVLYRDLGFSICLLNDISNQHLEYAISNIDSSNDLLLSGICAAILYSGFIPCKKDIEIIISSVENRDSNEGQTITPRCYIAAACYPWPSALIDGFLHKCAESSWPDLVEIANDSLAGKKSRYVLT
jgi:hypothetical protein